MRIATQHKTPPQPMVSTRPSAIIDIGQTSDLLLDCAAWAVDVSCAAKLISGCRLYVYTRKGKNDAVGIEWAVSLFALESLR
jgi:hypothetical protein